MLQPTLKQIWSREGWITFVRDCKYAHYLPKSRGYYQLRSVVRWSFWFSWVVMANQLLGWVDTWKP